MRILQIFNRYTYIGGEEIAVAQISRELASHHDFLAITFDSQEWAEEIGLINRMRQLVSMVWNPQSINCVREAVRDFRPDVILTHNLMPVGSAGLFLYLKGCGVPVVQFIHNFRPFSVNGYCWGSGRLLPQGIRKNFLPEILAGSWQHSRIKTAWYALILRCLHALGVYQSIQGWIAISNFMRDTFIKGGIDPDRIRVISHSWQPLCTEDEIRQHEDASGEQAFLFLGRITEEKGVRVLLDAWEEFEKSTDSGKLWIAGEGPLAEEVRARCERLRRASYLGFIAGEEKRQLLRKCTAMVVPSVWWEPLGLVLYEAYDHGKPVLAARSGGIVDHVEDGRTGWMHEPGDAHMLATHLLEAASSAGECGTRGANGRKLLLERGHSVWIDEFNDFVGKTVARAAANLTDESCSGGVSPSLESNAEAQAAAGADDTVAAVCDRRTKHADDRPAPDTEFHHRSGGDSSASTVTDRRYNPDAKSPTVIDRRYCTSGPSTISNLQSTISISVYLADQNPGHDRSFGISRMSQVVLEALQAAGGLSIEAVVSKTSQQAPGDVITRKTLPWGTRRKSVRLLTDHFHPFFHNGDQPPDVYYFPKGYLPLLHQFCQPSVVTIHDTIIQYDEDHYPEWRRRWEYAYWAWMLKHTLRRADRILTVSEFSKRQIGRFMERHRIPPKEITVTYEPCAYEHLAQPEAPSKENHVLHLASREPHKRSAHLVRWWSEAEKQGRKMPMLHLVGNVPPEVAPLLTRSRSIVKRPFLEDAALQDAYRSARALILPSEIEGFGLPALEAYYLGTPVCYVKGTSVEEVLGVTTHKGGFSLEEPESLFAALGEVMAMDAEEVRQCGLKLRETYASEKVAERMIGAFREMMQSR